MAATKYTYSISQDFPNQKVDSDRLTLEIQNSAIITALDYIETDGDSCDIWFKAELSPGDQSILSTVVANHSGEPLPEPTTDVNIKSQDASLDLHTVDHGFQDLTGYNVYLPGHRFVATAGQINNFDVSYEVDYKLQGMEFQLGGNPADGDRISIQLVDVDGIVYPAGTVLITFANGLYVTPNHTFKCVCNDAKTFYSWMYARMVYDSVGSEDVIVYWAHHLRTIPA